MLGREYIQTNWKTKCLNQFWGKMPCKGQTHKWGGREPQRQKSNSKSDGSRNAYANKSWQERRE